MPMLGDIAYVEEIFDLLHDYPNVYVDMTILNFVVPLPVHRGAVQQFVDRGFADRIMFGTYNLDAGEILARYRSMEFLSESELRGFFYDNAARFLRLRPAEERGLETRSGSVSTEGDPDL